MTINSKYIKLALLEYYRLDRGYAVATECNNEDILAINNKHSIAVEIKMSLSDLYRDRKKNKHFWMRQLLQGSNEIYANKFYYCILPDMIKKADEFIHNINSKYGIMIYFPETIEKKHHIKVYKVAKMLHDYYSEYIRGKVIMRLSSEVMNYYEKELYADR
jgi:hypothetical protein